MTQSKSFENLEVVVSHQQQQQFLRSSSGTNVEEFKCIEASLRRQQIDDMADIVQNGVQEKFRQLMSAREAFDDL